MSPGAELPQSVQFLARFALQGRETPLKYRFNHRPVCQGHCCESPRVAWLRWPEALQVR